MGSVEKLVRMSGQVTPRDKLCRFLQYGSKCCWYFGGVGRRPVLSKEYVDRLKMLESNISMGRRMLRLGRSLPVLHSALQTLHLSDVVRRAALTLSRIASAIYLAVDNFIWLARVGLIRADVKYWTSVSSRLWLLSILCNIIRDLYEILCLFNTFKEEDRNSKTVRIKWKSFAAHLVEKERPLLLDTSSNLADMLLPMSTLAYVSITPGIEGLLGFLSSVVGLISVWNPALKMVP